MSINLQSDARSSPVSSIHIHLAFGRLFRVSLIKEYKQYISDES